MWVKNWEAATGSVLLSGVRPRLGRFSHELLHWVERILPALARIYSRRLVRRMARETHRLAALAVLRVETYLEKTLHKLRHTTDARRVTREASPFLRQVAEHKKKLLREEAERDTVV